MGVVCITTKSGDAKRSSKGTLLSITDIAKNNNIYDAREVNPVDKRVKVPLVMGKTVNPVEL